MQSKDFHEACRVQRSVSPRTMPEHRATPGRRKASSERWPAPEARQVGSSLGWQMLQREADCPPHAAGSAHRGPPWLLRLQAKGFVSSRARTATQASRGPSVERHSCNHGARAIHNGSERPKACGAPPRSAPISQQTLLWVPRMSSRLEPVWQGGRPGRLRPPPQQLQRAPAALPPPGAHQSHVTGGEPRPRW